MQSGVFQRIDSGVGLFWFEVRVPTLKFCVLFIVLMLSFTACRRIADACAPRTRESFSWRFCSINAAIRSSGWVRTWASVGRMHG